MLRFFSKIRYQFAAENKVISYLRYAIGEILLVVIGILIALQINNWNRERQLAELELKYLIEIKSNLEADLEDIGHAINYTQEKLRINKTVLNYLNKHLHYDNSLSYELGNLNGSLHFTANTSAIEGLKIAGINLISNDSLRKEISYLYDYVYAHIVYLETNDDHRFQYEILLPQIFANLKISEFNVNAEPLNYEELYSNVQFKNVVSGNIWYRNFMLSQYRWQQNNVNKLIQSIAVEIKNF